MSSLARKKYICVSLFLVSAGLNASAVSVSYAETDVHPSTPGSTTIESTSTNTSIPENSTATNKQSPGELDDSAIELPSIPFDEYIPEGAFFTWLDQKEAAVTSRIETIATTMDDYFVEDGDSYYASGSYLRIRQSLTFKERGIIETPTSVSFKLRLPNTEKKLKLFFETSEQKNPYDTSTSTTETPPATVVGENNYAIGLQGESGERFGWKYKPTLGANIDSGVDPFLRFRFSKAVPFATWDINWQETPQWYNSIGWGVDSYFEINKPLSKNILFRSATFGGWLYDTDNTDLNHFFTVFHKIDDKKHISYYTGVYGVSQPMIYTTEFLVGITYRQDIHKNYLFLEVEPQIHYFKTNRFHPEHSITFRLEMLFKK